MAKWKRIRCSNCSGYGVGMYGDGPVWECNNCGGSGSVWVSEKDRVAQWPGGPFLGSWPGKYARAVEATGIDNDWTPPPSDEELFGWLTEEIFILEGALQQIVAYAGVVYKHSQDEALGYCLDKAEKVSPKQRLYRRDNERTI